MRRSNTNRPDWSTENLHVDTTYKIKFYITRGGWGGGGQRQMADWVLSFIKRGFTIPGRQVNLAAKFCTMEPYIFGSSVWNLLHITILVHRILIRLLNFWKTSLPLLQGVLRYHGPTSCVKWPVNWICISAICMYGADISLSHLPQTKIHKRLSNDKYEPKWGKRLGSYTNNIYL
jgi:hypothetical protein